MLRDAQRDRGIEDLLHVAEQAGLELVAAKARAQRVGERHRLAVGLQRCGVVVLGSLHARQPFESPQAVVVGVRARHVARDCIEVGSGRVEGAGGEVRIAPAAQVEGLRLRRLRDQAQLRERFVGSIGGRVRVGERDQHQRPIALAGNREAVAIVLGRSVEAAAPGGHVAEYLEGRRCHLRRVAAAHRQRRARVFVGLVEHARIAVGNREVAQGDRPQRIVGVALAQMQRLGCSTNAQTKLALLGQCERLPAIAVAVELDHVALVQRAPLGAERHQRFGILLARHCALERRARRGRIGGDGLGRRLVLRASRHVEEARAAQERGERHVRAKASGAPPAQHRRRCADCLECASIRLITH